MASFDTDGLEGLALSLEEIAALPEEVLGEMLRAEGRVIRQAHTQALAQLPKGDGTTGQLAASIGMSAGLRRGAAGVPEISVYPQGVRRDGKTRNAEVGFLVEYGAPQRGIAPRPWMRRANEAAADSAAAAAMRVYDDWLKSKGL